MSTTFEKKKTSGADRLVEKNPPPVPPPEGEDKVGRALRHKRLHYMMQEEKKQ